MSANVNIVILAGNIVRDPEVRHVASGTAVCDITVAVNDSRKIDGEWQEETHFIDVTCWGKTAENVGKWLRKGRPVAVEGRLRLDRWEDRDSGKKRSALKVTANRVHFLGSGDGAQGGGGKRRDDDGGSGRVEYVETEPGSTDTQDDLPF